MINYSIIIPHHNIPTLLRRCLDSIPERDDIQVIVVDDNSDPNRVDFKSFPGIDRKNVEIYYTKEGKGAGFARNIGLKHAKGKYLIFADADDYFEDGLDKLLDRHLISLDDITYYGITCKDSDTLEVVTNDPREFKYTNLMDNYFKTYDNSLLNWKPTNILNVPWGKIIKRDLITRYGILFDEVMAGNDMLFSLKCSLCATKITASPSKLYCVTTRLGSLSKSSYNSFMRRNRFEAAIHLNDYLYSVKVYERRYNLFILGIQYMSECKRDLCWALRMALIKTALYALPVDIIKAFFFVIKRGIQKLMQLC